MNEKFLLQFTPERWSPEQKFFQFVGVSKCFGPEAQKGARTCSDHIGKFDILVGLANRIAPDLQKDHDELDANGHSKNRYHREFTAMLEGMISEIYSGLDGVRRLLFSVYRHVKGIQNHSTEAMFNRATNASYGEGLPQEILDALKDANEAWFPRLRSLRTEIAHGEIGTCHLDRETKKIRYMHSGIPGSEAHRAFIIDDVISEIEIWRSGSVKLRDVVFKVMCGLFEQEPLFQMCGMYKARWYGRFVVPSQKLSFDDGYCVSRKWFMNDTELKCPLRSRCRAFENEWDGPVPW